MFLLHDFKIRKKIIAVFGEGLVGTSILSALCGQYIFTIETWGFSYADPARQGHELRRLADRISQLCAEATSDLCIVWCAGKAGFSATELEAGNELAIYRKVLECMQGLAPSFRNSRVSFHLVNSAGGLFEGQTHVTRCNKPSPKRPYGHLKMIQEELLLSLPVYILKNIYRLSTVYGHIRKGFRLGLISTLIFNGARQEVSRIFGTINTLRDYVWCEDIGSYIARAIAENDGDQNNSIVHLASGKPSSIFEIKHIVEQILNKKIYMAFTNSGENSSDITFSRTILPNCWYPVDMRTAVRSIYSTWKEQGSVL